MRAQTACCRSSRNYRRYGIALPNPWSGRTKFVARKGGPRRSAAPHGNESVGWKRRCAKLSKEEKKHERDRFVARASSSDPEAHVMRNGEGGTVPSYNVQLLTDTQHGIVVNVEATTDAIDYRQMKPALERCETEVGTQNPNKSWPTERKKTHWRGTRSALSEEFALPLIVWEGWETLRGRSCGCA